MNAPLDFNLEQLQLLEELARRSEHEFHKYKPYGGQIGFHTSDKYVRLLFGGNQSGKSRAAAQEVAWWFTHAHPYRDIPDRPVEIWVISTEYYTIVKGVYRHLQAILPDWEILAKGPKIQGHDLASYIKGKNGDLINFMSTKGGEDARTKFQAAEVDLAAIDEEIEEYVWDELQARMITTGGCFTISATLVESYDWIVKLEDKGEAGDPDISLTRLHTDKNPYANKEQVNRLANLWDDDTKRYRFYGKSRRSTGLVYKGFSVENIIEPFEIPKTWPRWCMLDPGFRTFAILWGTITPFGQRICYRELYIRNAELPDVVEEIFQLEKGEQVDTRIIDDKEGSRLVGGGIGIMSQLAQSYYLYCVPAIKAKHAGIEAVRKWCKIVKSNETYEYKIESNSQDKDELITLPKGTNFFVFNNLQNFLEEIRNYRIRKDQTRRDKNAPVDEPIKKKDHLMDCVRYWAISDPEYYLCRAGKDLDKAGDEWGLGTLQGAVDKFHEKGKREKVHSILGENW